MLNDTVVLKYETGQSALQYKYLNCIRRFSVPLFVEAVIDIAFREKGVVSSSVPCTGFTTSLQ